VWFLLVDSFQHRVDFIRLQVLHGLGAVTLRRNGQDPLASLDTFRMSRGYEFYEGADSCQSRIACGGQVSTSGFQMVKECDQIFGSKVDDIEVSNGARMTCGEETEQKDESIAVTRHCVWTETARERQVLREEKT